MTGTVQHQQPKPQPWPPRQRSAPVTSLRSVSVEARGATRDIALVMTDEAPKDPVSALQLARNPGSRRSFPKGRTSFRIELFELTCRHCQCGHPNLRRSLLSS